MFNGKQESIIQKAFALCLWVTRRGRLTQKGEGLLALHCNKIIEKCIKDLIEVCKIEKEEKDKG